MHPNSIYLDRKLFPTVTELCIMNAAQFIGARLRSEPGPHTIRADMTLAAFDGTALMGNEKSYLIGAVIKRQPGVTLLRQLLGSNAPSFEYVIFDPLEPEVVTFTGPRRLPNPLPEGSDLVEVDALLPRFPELTQANRALIGMLKYSLAIDPKAGADRLDLGNGWSVAVVNPWSPMFVITENAPSTAAEGDNEGAADVTFSLPA